MPYFLKGRKRYGPYAAAAAAAMSGIQYLNRYRRTGTGSSSSAVFKTPVPPKKQNRRAQRILRAARKMPGASYARLSRAARQKNFRNATTGRYVGKLRTKRWNIVKQKEMKFKKFGTEFVREDRGKVNDPNCVYVGHAIASQQVVQSVARAIVRAIWKKAGVDVVDFDNNIPMSAINSYTFSWKYIKDVTSNGVWVTRNINIVLGTSYERLAEDIVTDMVLVMTDANPVVEGPWQTIRVCDFTLISGLGTDNEQVMARITANGLNVEFDFYSSLAVQNITLAAAGGDINDELSTNVENNPLKGKIYQSTNMSNGLLVRYKPNSATPSFRNMVADRASGLIVENASFMGSDMYDKPPPAPFFNCVKSSGVILQPGQIKKDVIKFKNTMHINKFLNTFAVSMWRNTNLAGSPEAETWVPFGLAHVVALEKVLDSGSTEQNVNVGYEVTQYYKSFIHFKDDVVIPRVRTGL